MTTLESYREQASSDLPQVMGEETCDSDGYELSSIQSPIRRIVSFGTLEDILRVIEDGEQGLKERIQTIREDSQLMSRLATVWRRENDIIERGKQRNRDRDRRKGRNQISLQERVDDRTKGEDHNNQILEQETDNTRTGDQGRDDNQTSECRRGLKQVSDTEKGKSLTDSSQINESDLLSGKRLAVVWSAFLLYALL
jgi:hypothetical protein